MHTDGTIEAMVALAVLMPIVASMGGNAGTQTMTVAVRALATREIDRHCVPDTQGETLLKQAIARLGLSARAYHRILKVARTIADPAGVDRVAGAHVPEAIQYRRMDRA